MYGEILDLNGFPIEDFKSIDSQIIFYQNDGSERSNDKFSIRAIDNTIEYMVNVTVNLINDPPEFSVNSEFVFKPIEGFSNLLTKEFLSISDPDSDPAKVIIYILGQYASPSIDERTYLHTINKPRRPLKSFNLKQLQDHQIFVRQKVDEPEYRLIFKAKDEHDTSMMQILYTKPVKLAIEMETNKLIEVRQGGDFTLSNEEFRYVTNAPSNEIEVSYEVLDIPELGELLYQIADGTWIPAEFFTQQDINDGRIKYLHDISKTDPESESVKLKILTDGIDTNEEAEIQIKILKIEIRLTTGSIDIRNESSITLNEGFFQIDAQSIGGHKLETNNIQFAFTSLPILSSIIVNGSSVRRNKMVSYDDVLAGHIKLVINEEITKQAVDVLSVKIKIDALEHMAEFRINYLPDPEKIFIVNNALQIEEGAKSLVTGDHLYASNLRGDRIEIELLRTPQSGILRLINYSDDVSTAANMTRIRMEDIEEQRVYYDHDGSETTSDTFEFLLRNIDAGVRQTGSGLSPPMRFNISITLKNDNPPVQVVDRVFQVVQNSERAITEKDMWYKDPDIDFDDKNLIISRRGIDNGDIINLTTSEPIYEFSQKDLLTRNVVFRHRGAAYAEFVFWVKDGSHSTPGLMRVQAGKPRIQILNATTITVQKDSEALITPNNFSADTNLNINMNELEWFVVDEPSEGEFLVNNKKSRRWTQQNVIDNNVKFVHKPSTQNRYLDFCVLKSFYKELESTERRIQITIFMENYQLPLKLINNEKLNAREGESISITKDHILVTHVSATASEIEYQLTKKPLFGKIINDEGNAISKFTQADIIHGAIRYENTKAAMVDVFAINVTNHFTVISDIPISVRIELKTLPLHAETINDVLEAESVPLNHGLKLITDHFADEDIYNSVWIHIISGCKVGYIRRIGSDQDLDKFSYEDLLSGVVLYIHDGSEDHVDNCTFKAVPAESDEWHVESDEHTMRIDIQPVNNKPPIMVNNNVLIVWIDSATVITEKELRFTDEDTDPGHIVYETLPSKGGHLALRTSQKEKIVKFTQEQINNGDIVFVQIDDDNTRTGFLFQVNDGVQYSHGLLPFVIDTRQLEITLTLNPDAFHIFPGDKQQITKTDIWAKTNDVSEDHLVEFNIERAPEHGYLSDRRGRTISRFSQKDIEKGNVFYTARPEQPEWTTVDFFTFSVRAGPSKPIHQKSFYIQISYDRKGIPSLATLNPLVVEEGGIAFVNLSTVDASNFFKKLDADQSPADFELEYRIVRVPKHGQLYIGNRLQREKYEFTQEDLANNKIKYHHDHTDLTMDDFQLSTALVDLRYENVPKILDLSYNVSISVTGVNDNSPMLVRGNQLVKIVEGSHHRVTSDDFLVVDKDGDEILVEIVSESELGNFVHTDNKTKSVRMFTNKDVEDGNIYFVPVPNPTIGRPSGVTISFTDRVHPTVYKALRLEIVPLTMSLELAPINLIQGNFVIPITTNHIKVVTNGNLSDIICHLGETKNGELLIDSKQVSSFTPTDIARHNLVYILKNQLAASDEFNIECTSHLGRQEHATAQIQITSGIFMKGNTSFLLNPNSPTRFDTTMLDVSNLEEFAPIVFDAIASPLFSVLKYMPIDVNGTEECMTYIGYTFCNVDHFDSTEMIKSDIYLQSANNKSDEKLVVDLMISAPGLPRVPFHLPVIVGETDDPAFLPFFGIAKDHRKNQKSDLNPTVVPGAEPSVTGVPGSDVIETTAEGKLSTIKVTLDEARRMVENTDDENTDESTITLARLLYIIPIAIICILIIIIIGVVLLMRSNRKRRREAEHKHLAKYTPAVPVNNVKTEEGDKSTTYVIAAAQDSTVKVTVQQNKYESQLPATTVRALSPEESVFGGSSDDGGHTAYAGSNYFGVMSMSNYGESRVEDEFESESLVSFGTQITSQDHNHVQPETNVHRQQQYWV